MEININDKKKSVIIWTTKKEQLCGGYTESINSITNWYKSMKYKVAIFASGEHSLLTRTENLLIHNINANTIKV